MKALTALIILIAASVPFAANAQTSDTQSGVYQIMKATEDKVWRLNTQTGEIAVCTLEGENLFCTTTNEAAVAPQMTYEEREAQQERDATAADLERADKRERDMAFMDRMMELARSFIRTVMDHEQESQ